MSSALNLALWLPSDRQPVAGEAVVVKAVPANGPYETQFLTASSGGGGGGVTLPTATAEGQVLMSVASPSGFDWDASDTIDSGRF